MKNFTFFLLLALIMVSCADSITKDEPDPVEADMYTAFYETIADAMDAFEDFSDTVAVENNLRQLPSVRDVSRNGNIITVTDNNNMQVDVDLDVEDAETWYGEEAFDEKGFTEFVDSLSNAYGNNDFDADGVQLTEVEFPEFGGGQDDDTDPDVTPTRADYSDVVRILSKKKVYVWSPNIKFRSEDFNSVWYSVKYKKDKDGKAYGNKVKRPANYAPETFLNFCNYDLVFVSCHGNTRGDIIIPVSGMNEKVKQQYVSMIDQGVRYYYKTVIEKGQKKQRYTSFSLGKEFYDKYLPNLSKTIIWTSYCYSGIKDGSFMTACKEKNAANYIGTPQRCTGEGILKIFRKFYPRLAEGRSVTYSFNLKGNNTYTIDAVVTNPKTKKKEPIRYDYIRYLNHYASYFSPFVTGVKETGKARTRGESLPVELGVQFRYDLINGKVPTDRNECGIVLKHNGTNRFIPIGDCKIINENTRLMEDCFQIHDLTLSVEGLVAGQTYVYASYIKDDEGRIIVSDQCYAFTPEAEDTSGPYKIYTRDDLLAFMKAHYAEDSKILGRDVLLMNDIDLGSSYMVYKDYINESTNWQQRHSFYNVFDGQGHTITYDFTGINNNYMQSLIETSSGTFKNLKINVKGKDLKPYIDIGSFITVYNRGLIEDCHVTVDVSYSVPDQYDNEIENLICGFHNRGVIRDCTVKGKIRNGKCQGLVTLYNDDGAIINNIDVDIDFTGRVFTGIVDENQGNISDCRVSGTVICSLSAAGIARSNDHSYCSGNTVISECKNYANITSGDTRDYNSDIRTAGISLGNYDGEIIDCTNYGVVTGSGESAGICGSMQSHYLVTKITRCINKNKIVGRYSAAGICGRNWGAVFPESTPVNESIIEDCVNEATIVGGRKAAGICSENISKILRCENKGTITFFSGVDYKHDHGAYCDGLLKLGQIHTPWMIDKFGTATACKRNGKIVPPDGCWKEY